MEVTLVTGMPGARVRAVDPDRLDLSEVDLAAFAAATDTLVLSQAGEVVFRLR